MMKKLLVLILGIILLCGAALSVQAAESTTTAATTETAKTPGEHGELTVLGGTQWDSQGDFHLSKHFALTEIYKDNVLNLGILYQNTDSFRVNAGIRYDTVTQGTVPFGKVDFKIPFGDNLKIAGYGAQNYYGNDWTSYEVAIQVEVFKNLFIYPGVRGEFGNTVPTYSYNLSNDPYLFLRGDFNWKSGKFDFAVQPYLYICGEGVWFHNYTVKYHMNDNLALVVNTNTLFDQKPKFLAGIQWKF
jgi:opacity protein-like surface antigen